MPDPSRPDNPFKGRPPEPPNRFPVTELRFPTANVGFFTEIVDRTDPAYQLRLPIYRGQPYASMKGADQRIIDANTANPFYFLKQLRPGNTASSDFGANHDLVIWVWGQQQYAQDQYNADVSFAEEATGCPIFKREYMVKRQVWEATPSLTTGLALTSLISVNITAPGAGYTSATGVTATGATVFFVCFGGQIIDGIVTNGGSSVGSGAAITITGDGAGAAATARIQVAGCVLIAQNMKELPEDNPFSHDYVLVTRLYKFEPGPTLTEKSSTDEFNGATVFTDIKTP